MSRSVQRALPPMPLDRFETRQPADLNKVEADWKVQIGHAIQRCFSLAGLTQKEGAAKVGRDQAQVARWISGAERPQLDLLFAVEDLRQPLVLALAELAGNVEVQTVITIRRSA